MELEGNNPEVVQVCRSPSGFQVVSEEVEPVAVRKLKGEQPGYWIQEATGVGLDSLHAK